MNKLHSTKIIVIPVLVLFAHLAGAEVFMPGMQPKEAGIRFGEIQQCRMCHSGTPNGPADPFFSWQNGMMSQAARDPLFRAALTIANQDIPGVGEFCLRCHAPRGWLEDRSMPADGSALNEEDMYGISCIVCHRFIDPLSEEARKLVKDAPPGYGNAMMVADPANMVRGPYGDTAGVMPHQTMKSEFHASSNLCATCHNTSNPLQADDVKTQPPYAFGHIERTYSEWVLSDFAQQGPKGTCQSCHYPTVEGGGQASRFSSSHRDYFVIHGPVGAAYADGQYWDDVPLEVPEGCEKIVVKLMYQSASWEYIKFLTEENKTDDWGKRLYEAWKQTGQCAPVAIAEKELTIDN